MLTLLQGVKLREYKYIVNFETAEEGGFVVTVPSLPGLVSYGKDLAEAKEMAKDAIKCHLESLIKRSSSAPRKTKGSPKTTPFFYSSI